MANSALIGATGFVGSNLAGQHSFAAHFNSSNIGNIAGREFDLVVCAGIQAKKWWANQNPKDDWNGIAALLKQLETIRANQFVLISTVDIYPDPRNVDESHNPDQKRNHAYGRHRFWAEEFVRGRFDNHLVIRLPGLFGHGIKKNVIHDLLHNHELEKINPLGTYQYYHLRQLWPDIEKALALGLKLLNVSTEPVSTRDIAAALFPDRTLGSEAEFTATYDMRSVHWPAWNSTLPGYLYDRTAVLAELEDFIHKQRLLA